MINKKEINDLFLGLNDLDDYKICSKCGKDLPIAKFRLQAKGKNQPFGHCRDCSRKLNKERKRLKKVFGDPPKNYHCPICDISNENLVKEIARAKKDTPQTPGWVVDHDHDTGNFRGWLCAKCNFGIGMFKDNPSTLKKAFEYLNKYYKT